MYMDDEDDKKPTTQEDDATNADPGQGYQDDRIGEGYEGEDIAH